MLRGLREAAEMNRLVSSIYGRAPTDPLTEAQQDELARAAWRSGADLVAIRLSAVRDDWTRQALVNEATRQHGARKKFAERKDRK